MISRMKPQPLPTPTTQSSPGSGGSWRWHPGSPPDFSLCKRRSPASWPVPLQISGDIFLQRKTGTSRDLSRSITAAMGCYGRAAGA